MGYLLAFIILCLPGFILSFLGGCYWVAKGKLSLWKVTRLSALIGFFLALLFSTWIYYNYFYIHVIDHFSRPMTVQEARAARCPLDLPNEATNVRFSIARQGQGFFGVDEYRVCFDAPVDVCHALIEQSPHLIGLRLKLVPVEAHDSTSAIVIRTASVHTWFEPENIIHGETFDNGDGCQVWIDHDHGIFYYQEFNY